MAIDPFLGRKVYRPNQMYEITVTIGGKMVDPPKGRCWAATRSAVIRPTLSEIGILWPNNGNWTPRIKQFAGEEQGLGPHDFVAGI